MKTKTSELIGKALDYAVSAAEGFDINGRIIKEFPPPYSSRWQVGGPIIEREKLLLRPIQKDSHVLDGQWLAMYDGTNTGTTVQWVKRTDWPYHYLSGPTPLIAAMRCFVTSKLGDEVDIPEELV